MIPVTKRRTLFVILLLILTGEFLLPQTLNYREIFGNDWDKAELFLSQNRAMLQSKFKKTGTSYPVAVAVIFPELIRYSALRDKIEITLLKTLYINLGEEYANFSIGYLQMKPSFAERVHLDAAKLKDNKIGRMFNQRSDYRDIRKYRTTIVSDLQELNTQLNYLIAFIKICENKFDLASMSEDNRLRFLSTAYNYGFWHSRGQIESMDGGKYFRTTLLKTENYSYSDVSLFWYHMHLNKTRKTIMPVGQEEGK